MKTMNKLFLVLTLFALTFSCDSGQTEITTEVVNQETFAKGKPPGKGKPIKSEIGEPCPGVTALPTEANYWAWYSWDNQELISLHELVTRVFNAPITQYGPGVIVKWWPYETGFTGIHMQNAPCGQAYLTDGTVFDFGDFVYGFTIYKSDDNILDANDTAIEHICITPICSVTAYSINLEPGHYIYRWDDFVTISDEISELRYWFDVE